MRTTTNRCSHAEGHPPCRISSLNAIRRAWTNPKVDRVPCELMCRRFGTGNVALLNDHYSGQAEVPRQRGVRFTHSTARGWLQMSSRRSEKLMKQIQLRANLAPNTNYRLYRIAQETCNRLCSPFPDLRLYQLLANLDDYEYEAKSLTSESS